MTSFGVVVLLVTGPAAAADGDGRVLRPRSPEPLFRQGGVGAADACEGGAVVDDGTAETGYGWVPSAVDGRYVQRFTSAQVGSGDLLEVCVCWTRSRADATVDFEVQVYPDAGGVPALTPVASIPAAATAVPEFPGGAFTTVTLPAGVGWPSDPFYVGVAWNPSADQFFFVCADSSPGTPFVDTFFIDDRADEWGSAADTGDPTFADHRALMVRVVGSGGPIPVPAGGPVAAVLVIGFMAVAGGLLLRRW